MTTMKKTFSTNSLTLLTILIAIAIAYLGIQVREYGFIAEPYIYMFNTLLIFAVFFLLGCTGALWVIRKEAPQIIQLRGKSAVIFGLVMMIGSWIIAMYALILLFIHYTSLGG